MSILCRGTSMWLTWREATRLGLTLVSPAINLPRSSRPLASSALRTTKPAQSCYNSLKHLYLLYIIGLMQKYLKVLLWCCIKFVSSSMKLFAWSVTLGMFICLSIWKEIILMFVLC